MTRLLESVRREEWIALAKRVGYSHAADIIADGDRHFVGESYCKLSFRDADEYDVKRQVVCGTIPRQRTAMPAMLEFSTPDFYDDTLYPEHVLSPFFKGNHFL